jgi:prepilin-type N-terminal cleavage/methylation domain-containing protein
MTRRANQTGFSLTELISVIAILGTLAVVIVPRVLNHYTSAKRSSCFTQKREIELQVNLWKRNNGSYPAANLSNIGADANYFPDGLPTCPVDGTAYTIDTTTGRVSGHTH